MGSMPDSYVEALGLNSSIGQLLYSIYSHDTVMETSGKTHIYLSLKGIGSLLHISCPFCQRFLIQR